MKVFSSFYKNTGKYFTKITILPSFCLKYFWNLLRHQTSLNFKELFGTLQHLNGGSLITSPALGLDYSVSSSLQFFSSWSVSEGPRRNAHHHNHQISRRRIFLRMEELADRMSDGVEKSKQKYTYIIYN